MCAEKCPRAVVLFSAYFKSGFKYTVASAFSRNGQDKIAYGTKPSSQAAHLSKRAKSKHRMRAKHAAYAKRK